MKFPRASLEVRASRLLDYLVALAVVGFIAFLQPLIARQLGEGAPFLLFSIAIFVVVQIFGPRVGGLATLAAAGAGALFLWQSHVGAVGWNQLALFLVAAFSALSLSSMFRISERRRQRAQEHAEELARELQLMIDSATTFAICRLDTQGRIMFWNTGAERLFGWTEQDAVNQHLDLFFAPEERAEGVPKAHLEQAHKQGTINVTGWRVRRDGSDFFASITMSQIRNESGELIGFAKIVRDITNEQASAAAIEAREMLLRSILHTVPDAMVVIDERGVMKSFSAAAERLFGYTQDEVIGNNVSMLMTKTDSALHDGYLAHYRDTGERRIMGTTRRVVARRKDGSEFPHELHIGEAIGGGNRVFTGFIRDLTAREEADAHVLELQSELLHIARIGAMGTMASTLAHELNQPLTAVSNYVDTCRAMLEHPESAPADLLREAMAEASAEAIRAGRIVTRLREFVARGQIDKVVMPLETIVEDARMLALADAREKGVSHSISIDPEIGPVLVDRVQIEQVLINLLRNAMEAMQGGGGGHIAITAGTDGDMAEIAVTDDGPGISPDLQEGLFKAFVSTKRDGMGLGLSICRTIVEAHGGRIWVEQGAQTNDQKGPGTSFHFTIPRALTEDAHE